MEKTIHNTINNRDQLLTRSLYKHPVELHVKGSETVKMNVVGTGYAEGRSTQRQRHELLKMLIGRE